VCLRRARAAHERQHAGLPGADGGRDAGHRGGACGVADGGLGTGAKGAGEAGTAGATEAVANAVNDALRVLGAREITEVPITPEGVLRALGRGA
jgi:hypothetical protein